MSASDGPIGPVPCRCDPVCVGVAEGLGEMVWQCGMGVVVEEAVVVRRAGHVGGTLVVDEETNYSWSLGSHEVG